MKCPVQAGGNADVLLDYCAHTLDRETAALLESHMVDCADCRAFRDAQSELWTDLDEWQPLPVSSDFNRRLFARLDAEDQRPWWRQWRGFLATLQADPAMPLAVMALLVLSGFLLQTNSVIPVAPSPLPLRSEIRADFNDVEQAVRELEDMDLLLSVPDLLTPGDSQSARSI